MKLSEDQHLHIAAAFEETIVESVKESYGGDDEDVREVFAMLGDNATTHDEEG